MYRKNMVLPTLIFLLLIAFSLTPPIALGATGPIQVTVGKSTIFNIKDERLLGVVYARVNHKTAKNTLRFKVSSIKGADCKPLSKCTRLTIAASRSAVPGLYKIDLLDGNRRLIGNYELRVNKRIAALGITQKKATATTPITQQKSTSISRQSSTKKILSASLNIAPGQTKSLLLKNRSALNAIKYQVIPKTASRYFKVSLKKVFGNACKTQSRCMQAQVIASRLAVAGDYSLSLIDANNRTVGTAQIKVSTSTAQKAPAKKLVAKTIAKQSTIDSVGTEGVQGPPGPPGKDGVAGLHCWDLDGDGIKDPEEDITSDGVHNALDCKGPKGDPGDTVVISPNSGGSGGSALGPRTADAYQTYSGFSVEISPGSPVSESQFDSYSGGGIKFHEDSATTGADQFSSSSIAISEWLPIRLTGRFGTGSSGHAKELRNIVFTSSFQTDLSTQVVAINLGQVRFPPVPSSDGRHLQYKTFQPGQPEFSEMEFTIASTDALIVDWVKQNYQGRDARRTISVELMNRTRDIVITYSLFDCIPVNYEPISFNSSIPGISDTHLTIKCQRVGISGGQSPILQWYDAMMTSGNASDIYKDVSIILKGRDGSDIKAINYLQSFLTTYRFPVLNAREDSVEAIEIIEIQPGYSDNLLVR